MVIIANSENGPEDAELIQQDDLDLFRQKQYKNNICFPQLATSRSTSAASTFISAASLI